MLHGHTSYGGICSGASRNHLKFEFGAVITPFGGASFARHGVHDVHRAHYLNLSAAIQDVSGQTLTSYPSNLNLSYQRAPPCKPAFALNSSRVPPPCKFTGPGAPQANAYKGFGFKRPLTVVWQSISETSNKRSISFDSRVLTKVRKFETAPVCFPMLAKVSNPDSRNRWSAPKPAKSAGRLIRRSMVRRPGLRVRLSNSLPTFSVIASC